MTDGWSELGAVLGAGPQLKQQAYQQGVLSGARQAALLENARKTRDANIAMQMIPTEIQRAQAGDPGADASLVSTLFQAGKDPRQYSGYQLQQHQLTSLNNVAPAAQALGYTPAQATAVGALVGANGGKNVDQSILGAMRLQAPVAGTAAVPQDKSDLLNAMGLKTTGIANGVAFNPYGAPNQSVNVTPVGQADIGLKGAQANAANAHAALFSKQTEVGGFSPKAGSPFGGDGSNSFTPDAQSLLATATEQGLKIPIPSVGMGGAARVQFVNGLAADLKKKNIPFDLGLQEMRYGLTADPGIKKSQQLYSTTRTLEAGADALAQQAKQLSGTVSRGQIPLFNAWVNAGRRATSDPNIARFDRAINAFTHDYAKVVSGSLGSSPGSDASIKSATEQLMASNSPEVFAANIDQMQKEMHVRTQGMLDSIRAQVANIATGGHASGSAPTFGVTPSTAAPAAASAVRAVNPTTGHAMVWNGSAWVSEP